MNITKYYSKDDKKAPIYRARATLQKGYTVVNADELFYRYVGSNSANPFPLMVHPEDAACVKDALERLDEGAQRLILRLLCDDGSYRYMYVVFEHNGREQDGFKYVDVSMLDIMRIHHRYESDYVRLVKYRKFMSLSSQLYFEYLFDTDQVSIYEYVNERSIPRFKDTLENLQQNVLDSDAFTFKQKAEFEGLVEYLKSSAETMELELDGEIFGLDCGYMHLNGGLVYIENKKEMMAGVFTVTGEVKRDDKYYLSVHAFDNATGVYNKRAIKEIAMELIAKATSNKVLLAVMDIDDFKNINDVYGHMMGDEIIAKVAEVIRTTLGHRGYVGRFGGDEFMVVTEKVKDTEDFAKIFKTVRKNIQWSCGELLNGMEVTLSIGVATYPDHAANYDELFQIADKCLYIGKAKGKNRVINYKPEMHAGYDMAKETKEKGMPLSVDQACNAVVRLMGNTLVNTYEELNKDVKGFLNEYGIHRIMICEGVNYTTCHVVNGDQIAEDAPAPLLQMDFWNHEDADLLFDTNGVLVRNRVESYEDTYPNMCQQLAKQGTDSFVAVKVKMDDGKNLLVFFDMVHMHHKWSTNESGLLHISAWIIARRYLRVINEKV